jgi:hypothetical protein
MQALEVIDEAGNRGNDFAVAADIKRALRQYRSGEADGAGWGADLGP